MGIQSDSWQLCFSLKLSFLEAHPFSEILSRLDTNSSADFYLSISLIYFPFLCSGGRECPFQVLVAFSVNDEFMLVAQHLAESGLRSRLGLSGGIAVRKESRCSGNIASARSRGKPGAPCLSRSLWLHWGSDPELQSFSIARREEEEEEALGGVGSPVRTGERWERAVGKDHARALGLGGDQQPHRHLPPGLGLEVPLNVKQNQRSGGCVLVYGRCCVSLLGKCFGIAWIWKAWREDSFYCMVF